MAAVTILLLGFGAIVGAQSIRTEPVDETSTSATQASLPAGAPVLLDPAADSMVTVTGRDRFVSDRPTAGGAVLSPSGTVFGIAVVPTAPIDLAVLPDSYNERTIAGRAAWGMEDGSAPKQIYRGIEIECATLSVTTAGEPMWSSDIELLASSIESDGTTLTVTLPAGWTSLGATTVAETHNSTLAVRVNGVDYRARLTQAIGAAVGPLLTTMETNPTKVSNGTTSELWHIEGATTPGYNTLIGTRRGTAFSVSGNAPTDVLTEILDALVAVPASDWLQRPTAPEPPDDTVMAESIGTLPSCSLRDLNVLETS